MNVIFLSDTGNVIFKCILWEKIIFVFLTEGWYHIYRKKYDLNRIYKNHHISMYFFKKNDLSFCVQRIRWHFRENNKISSFLIIQEKSYSSTIFWEDYLFRTFAENIIFPFFFFFFFFWERSSFTFCLKNKIIFLGKRSILSW